MVTVFSACKTTNPSHNSSKVQREAEGESNWQHATELQLAGKIDTPVRFVSDAPEDDPDNGEIACLNRVILDDGSLDSVKFDKNACALNSSLWFVYFTDSGFPYITAEKRVEEVDILQARSTLVT